MQEDKTEYSKILEHIYSKNTKADDRSEALSSSGYTIRGGRDYTSLIGNMTASDFFAMEDLRLKHELLEVEKQRLEVEKETLRTQKEIFEYLKLKRANDYVANDPYYDVTRFE